MLAYLLALGALSVLSAMLYWKFGARYKGVFGVLLAAIIMVTVTEGYRTADLWLETRHAAMADAQTTTGVIAGIETDGAKDPVAVMAGGDRVPFSAELEDWRPGEMLVYVKQPAFTVDFYMTPVRTGEWVYSRTEMVGD